MFFIIFIKMKKTIIILFLLFMLKGQLYSQEFYPIWEGKMPNSKGLVIKDSIANERVYQVGTPGVYAFEPSVAENKNVAVLIIPGGGYARLAYQISGMQIAKWFNTFGVTAFVLNHRLPQSPDVIESHKAPLQDAQQAIKFIRKNADKWNIDIQKVGVMGCSAGGHLSACVSTFSEDWTLMDKKKDTVNYIPNFTILISPVISMNEYVNKGSRDNLLGKDASQELKDMFSCDKRVSSNTPPAFLVHAFNDGSVPPMNSILYYSALIKHKIKISSLHIYPEGEHSIALRNNPGATNSWTALCEQWLSEIGIITNSK